MKKSKQSLKTIDAPNYSYFQAIYRSFFYGPLYVDVAKRWKGLGVLYLLLIVVIFSTPMSFMIIKVFNTYFNEQIKKPLSLIPTVLIQNGRVKFDKPMPFEIKNNKNQTLVVIDTKAKPQKLLNAFPDLKILISQKDMFFRLPKNPLDSVVQGGEGRMLIQKFSFDKDMNQIMTGKSLIKQTGIKKLTYLFIALTPFLVISFVFFLFLSILLAMALMGQLVAQSFFNYKINYKSSSRVTMVAFTPVCVLLFVLYSFNYLFSGLGLLLMAAFYIYYCFAILFIKKSSQKVARQ